MSTQGDNTVSDVYYRYTEQSQDQDSEVLLRLPHREPNMQSTIRSDVDRSIQDASYEVANEQALVSLRDRKANIRERLSKLKRQEDQLDWRRIV